MPTNNLSPHQTVIQFKGANMTSKDANDLLLKQNLPLKLFSLAAMYAFIEEAIQVWGDQPCLEKQQYDIEQLALEL